MNSCTWPLRCAHYSVGPDMGAGTKLRFSSRTACAVTRLRQTRPQGLSLDCLISKSALWTWLRPFLHGWRSCLWPPMKNGPKTGQAGPICAPQNKPHVQLCSASLDSPKALSGPHLRLLSEVPPSERRLSFGPQTAPEAMQPLAPSET